MGIVGLFAEIPDVEAPARGILASANNSPAAGGDGPFLGVDWLDGYRVGRIFEALECRENWDVVATIRRFVSLSRRPRPTPTYLTTAL